MRFRNSICKSQIRSSFAKNFSNVRFKLKDFPLIYSSFLISFSATLKASLILLQMFSFPNKS